MSGFTALNVEPEDTFEEEIDDTREIQLEEAFKLYQNALKLHSQGPESFEEAREAYKELLQSEIFKYPEVVSDFSHDELDDEATAAAPQPDSGSLSLLPSNAAQSSASSVPQLLYLAFKNKGQFALDVARHQLPDKNDSQADLCKYYAYACKESLGDFARALERDDTDLDLWKKAARVAEVLSTQRIARFCLESVVAGDDEDTEQGVDLSGLDEAFAAGELEDVVKLVQDDLTRLQSSDIRPKSQLLLALRKTNDPYRFLPKRTKVLDYLDDKRRPLSFEVMQIDLQPSSSDLLSLGSKILETIISIQDGTLNVGPATTIKAVLPGLEQLAHKVEITFPFKETNTLVPDDGDKTKESTLPITESGMEVDSPAEQASIGDLKTEKDTSDPQDVEKTDLAPDEETTEVQQANTERQETMGVTSRKRSSTVAGNEEPEGRTKSKRLRARESLADLAGHEEEAAHEDPQYFLDQLAVYEEADQATFKVVNSLLSKFDMSLYPSTEAAKKAFWNETYEGDSGIDPLKHKEDLKLLADLRLALSNWSDKKSQAILGGHGNQEFVEKSAGMSLFLQHSKTVTSKGFQPSAGSNEAALSSVVGLINSGATNIYDAAIYWLSSMLATSKDKNKPSLSSYLRETWPAELKNTVLELIVATEPHLYDLFRQRLDSLVHDQSGDSSSQRAFLFEVAETLFELYLDTYSAATRPGGDTAQSTLAEHANRLKRWSSMANEFLQVYLNCTFERDLADPLILRFLWASTTYATLAEDVDKAHVVLCLEDMRKLLERIKADPIFLSNNTAMPVISVSAIEQEISRLNTLDFFTDVFDSDNSDPVAVIEKLEPILESETSSAEDGQPTANTGTQQTEQLVKFLESGDASLKLFLWRRLQNAYTSISYTPKVVSCLLRALEISVNELYTSRHLETEPNARQVSMLKWLRDIDELMSKLLVKILNDPTNPLECVDDAHLRSSLSALTSLVRLLHGFVIYEDSLRVGQTSGPQIKGASSTKLYEKSKDRFKEMVAHSWTLQYALLKEATLQDPASYGRAGDKLAEYLSAAHNSLGIRHYCKHANKAFVKLVKSELGSLDTEQDYAADMAQVFFDLYQLRFASGIGDSEHECPAEPLDKKTAWSLVPTIMRYVERFNVKDLIKSELKGSIDKIQNALGTVKSVGPLAHNRRVITAYLKSIINATDLYKCIRGIGDLPTRPVQGESQATASCGWYFLLGSLSLSKYKSVKRVSPTPTDDLDVAAGFFRQDLDHNIDSWESWYRLAQVYEAKIEDDLIWNSTKLNDSRNELALLERQTIHCYMMATTVAMRSADVGVDTAQKIEDMLTEFATRLYASSRPPLDMEAFKTDKYVRHMSSVVDQTMSKEPYYKPVEQYALWQFAAHLLSRKLTEKPKPWTSHYTRAKCLWKMFKDSENRGRVSPEDVIEPIIEAIESLPKKEKSNEPILEPHFKLVSIVHKMVREHSITHTQAHRYLQASRYSQGVHLSDDEQDVEWVPYILEILKKLGHADKSNWHHRITDRAAHVIFEDDPGVAGALGAKHQFTQQIFTKTMTMQVWKPENERPGRHYVYTGRYITFFVYMLEQLNDRANLDQLVRRLRRKTTDFLDHTKIWEEVTGAYVRLLRRTAAIQDGRERALFDGMNHEEFTKKSEMMEKWALDPDTSSVFLDVMRDGVELKRLNNSLMKGPVIDDLIGDSYACLYEEFVSQLPPEEQVKSQPAPLPQGTFINMTTDLAGGADEEAERARLNNVLRAQGDGAADGPLAVSISAPVGLGFQNSPAFTGAGGQLIPEVHRAPAKPGRTKTVTRREIQRKAEAAIVKPPPIKTPILSKRPTIEILVPSKGDLESTNMDSPTDKRLTDVKDEDMDGSRVSSRRGSVQDSADGEADGEDESGSEMSGVEDMNEENKRARPEVETPRENAEDGPDDAGEDGADAEDAGEETGDDGGDAGEEGMEEDQKSGAEEDQKSDQEDDQKSDQEEDQKSDQEDEEMLDAEDEIEVHPSRRHIVDTPGDDDMDEEDEEFHEAREDNTAAE